MEKKNTKLDVKKLAPKKIRRAKSKYCKVKIGRTVKNSKTKKSDKPKKSKTIQKEGRDVRIKRRLDLQKKLSKRGRLYAKAIVTGYRRGQRNQYENISLLKVDGAHSKEDASFYVGKMCAYMYKCKNGSLTKHGQKNKVRVVWGRVMRPHGNTGSVRAKFSKNLPASALTKRVRIMLYPSNI